MINLSNELSITTFKLRNSFNRLIEVGYLDRRQISQGCEYSVYDRIIVTEI